MKEKLTLKNTALFGIVVVALGGLLLGFQGLLTKDGNETAPQNVLISDVRSGTVNVSWITTKRAATKLYYGTTPALGSEATTPGLSAAHLVNLSNLLPNTTYYFAVGNDQQKFTQDGITGEVPFTFRTLALVENKPVVAAVAIERKSEVASAFGNLIKPTNATSRVLAEATAGGTPGIGTTGTTGGTPNGATTLPTIFLAVVAALFVTLGLKLLKN